MKFSTRTISFILLASILFSTCQEGAKKIETQVEEPINIILLIGDGMGLAQISAALAIHGSLSLELFQHIGLIKTSSADDYITDSAAGATAYSCGVKTYNGAIGLTKDSIRVETLLELAEKKGLATGLISTCSVTHATPAAFYSHCKSREFNEEIAASLYEKGIDFIAGGGKPYFDLAQLEANQYRVHTGQDVQAFDAFSKHFWFYNDSIHPPGAELRKNWLSVATAAGIKHLSQNKKGFFLMVEGSQIDWGGHNNDLKEVVDELIDFDMAIQEALAFAKTQKRTLVLVTADHETGGLSLDGGDLKAKTLIGNFSSMHHTGIMVPVFSFGYGSEQFTGTYENVKLYHKMRKVYGF